MAAEEVLDDPGHARVHAFGEGRIKGAFIAAGLIFLVIDAAGLELGKARKVRFGFSTSRTTGEPGQPPKPRSFR